MRNRYPGICYACNHPVEVGQGHFEKSSRDLFRRTGVKWFVIHAACSIARKEALYANNALAAQEVKP